MSVRTTDRPAFRYQDASRLAGSQPTLRLPQLEPLTLSVRAMAVPAVVLASIGLVYANSASFPAMVRTGEALELSLLKHLAAFAAGLICMFALSRVTYDRLRMMAWPILLACLVTLGLVWMPGVGHEANGSNRWIGWGPIKLQPSEFAKVGMVLYLAALITQPRYDIKDLCNGLLAPLTAIAVACVLVEREPDLGTAIVMFCTCMSVLYVAGANRKHLAVVLALATLAGALFTAIADHRRDRIGAWLNPDAYRETEGFQIKESLIAVGENGLMGKGFGRGEARYYVPAAGTDYIMATVAEETGLPGVVVILGLIGVLVWQAYRVAARSHDRFAVLVAAGIGSLFMWQTLLNVAVVTNCVPSTGVPMPFISAGGSSLIACLAAIGILARPAVQNRVARNVSPLHREAR